VKKISLQKLVINSEKNIEQEYSNNQIKTTDVNILLNRVRQDKIKDLKKKFLVSLIFILFLALVTAYSFL
tara:strand:+ start:506 stop:715 length:210 start_codon:yes stop_codon:yes gene_type:complete